MPDHLRRDVVCRYWLHDMCVAGDECRFLHLMVRSKLPVCKYVLLQQPCPDGARCVLSHDIHEGVIMAAPPQH